MSRLHDSPRGRRATRGRQAGSSSARTSSCDRTGSTDRGNAPDERLQFISPLPSSQVAPVPFNIRAASVRRLLVRQTKGADSTVGRSCRLNRGRMHDVELFLCSPHRDNNDTRHILADISQQQIRQSIVGMQQSRATSLQVSAHYSCASKIPGDGGPGGDRVPSHSRA